MYYFPPISLFLAVVTMPVCIKLAHRWGLFDMPDQDRKLHGRQVPFTGGLSLIFAFLTTSIISFLFPVEEIWQTLHPADSPIFVYVLEAGAIILVLGIVDDLTDVTFQRKFIFQFLAAFFVILGAIRGDVYPHVFGVTESSVIYNSIGTVVTVLWIVGLTNAVNMIDGMDGLAAGTSLISVTAFGILALLWGDPVLASLCFILGGALIGFLLFNFHPARVFMGDTGSMFLGFTLGVLGWLLVDRGPMKLTVFFVPIIMLGLPISDTLLAFFRRIIKKQNPFTGDRFHIHHMMKSRFGLSSQATVLILYGIALIYAGAGLCVALLPEVFGWLLLGVLVIAQGYFFHLLGYVRLVFQSEPDDLLLEAPLVKTNGVHVKPMNGSQASKPSRSASREH